MMDDKYQLYLGDCLEYMRTMEPGSVDAIITDLPYGTTACAWDEIIPFAPMWEGVKRILKPRGAFVTTASQPFTSKLIMSNLDWFKYEWIWIKDRPSNVLTAKFNPLKYHENICVFSVNGNEYNPQMRPRSKYNKRNNKPRVNHSNHFGDIYLEHSAGANDSIFPGSDLFYNLPQDYLHPTQKPVALYSYLIQTYTNPVALVFDMCMGSGTTGVACMQLGRRFIGCEIDEGYFKIAEKRIKTAAMQMLLPFDGG